MKKVTKFFMAAFLAGMCNFGYAQDFKSAPKPYEKVIGSITCTTTCTSSYYAENDVYDQLLDRAKTTYPNYLAIDIRNFKKTDTYSSFSNCTFSKGEGEVVDLIPNYLAQAFNKALRNVREGSRMAIDQVTVPAGMDKSVFKDVIIDYLLDNDYRVIAKDYLDKLYEEQKAQQSGIYNDKTTVQENNFSAVGYYVNVKVLDSSIRVQIVNVSTGEYEGNATVNF